MSEKAGVLGLSTELHQEQAEATLASFRNGRDFSDLNVGEPIGDGYIATVYSLAGATTYQGGVLKVLEGDPLLLQGIGLYRMDSFNQNMLALEAIQTRVNNPRFRSSYPVILAAGSFKGKLAVIETNINRGERSSPLREFPGLQAEG